MYTRPTIEEIYSRLKADVESKMTGDVKITRVSLIGLFTAAFSGSIYLAYGFMIWIAKQLFVDTATDIGRERWANILNIPRKAATFTDGYAAFTGTAAFVVPSGTRIQDSNGSVYSTSASFTIGTTVSVEAVAVVEGAGSNTTDTSLELVSSDADIDTTVTLVSGFDNGADQETEANWVLRLLQRFQNPPASGGTEDYVRWLLAVPGVDRAWCYGGEDYDGAGTVGNYVASSDLSAPAAGVVVAANAAVEAAKPIPAQQTTAAVSAITTEYFIDVTPYSAEVATTIQTNLSLMHIGESEPGGTIPISHVRSAIAASGVDDYSITDIELDGASIGAVDIVTVAPEIAQYTSATVGSL